MRISRGIAGLSKVVYAKKGKTFSPFEKKGVVGGKNLARKTLKKVSPGAYKAVGIWETGDANFSHYASDTAKKKRRSRK